MKQSTLHIDYTNALCEFDNLYTYSFEKEHDNLTIALIIYSKDKTKSIKLTDPNYVHITPHSNGFTLNFKSTYYFNRFLMDSRDELNLFKVTKLNFFDIKGI